MATRDQCNMCRRHRLNADLRRWPDIKSALGECLVFAVCVLYDVVINRHYMHHLDQYPNNPKDRDVQNHKAVTA